MLRKASGVTQVGRRPLTEFVRVVIAAETSTLNVHLEMCVKNYLMFD